MTNVNTSIFNLNAHPDHPAVVGEKTISSNANSGWKQKNSYPASQKQPSKLEIHRGWEERSFKARVSFNGPLPDPPTQTGPMGCPIFPTSVPCHFGGRVQSNVLQHFDHATALLYSYKTMICIGNKFPTLQSKEDVLFSGN